MGPTSIEYIRSFFFFFFFPSMAVSFTKYYHLSLEKRVLLI